MARLTSTESAIGEVFRALWSRSENVRRAKVREILQVSVIDRIHTTD